MSTCKYCGEEIEWREKDGKKFPANPTTGIRHDCPKNNSQPAPASGNQSGGSCTSPATPQNNAGKGDGLPRSSDGKIASINPQTRVFTFRPDGGFAVDVVWSPNQDATMQKFKEKYQAKVTYEPGSPNRLIEIVSTKKWEDRGGKGQPRNERVIVLQCCMKVAADVYNASTSDGNPRTYEDTMAVITSEAIKAAGELCKAGGVA